MEIAGSITLQVIISVLAALISFLSAYFSIKFKVKQMENEINTIKEKKKELMQELKIIERKINENQTNFSALKSELKADLLQMKLDIIEGIKEVYKPLNK